MCVVVTGSEMPTGRKLVEKLLAKGIPVAAPVAGAESRAAETAAPNLNVLSWNRSSWFSTKAVVREILRQHKRIDAFWLLHDHASGSLSDTGDIDRVLENSVKGSLALAREILPFLETDGGFLGMVIPHSNPEAAGALEAMAAGAFAGFSNQMIHETGPSVWSCGCVSHSPDADGFTAGIIRIQDERPAKIRGKWYHYTENRRLFGGTAVTQTPF